jgi:hypothetical protein
MEKNCLEKIEGEKNIEFEAKQEKQEIKKLQDIVNFLIKNLFQKFFDESNYDLLFNSYQKLNSKDFKIYFSLEETIEKIDYILAKTKFKELLAKNNLDDFLFEIFEKQGLETKKEIINILISLQIHQEEFLDYFYFENEQAKIEFLVVLGVIMFNLGNFDLAEKFFALVDKKIDLLEVKDVIDFYNLWHKTLVIKEDFDKEELILNRFINKLLDIFNNLSFKLKNYNLSSEIFTENMESLISILSLIKICYQSLVKNYYLRLIDLDKENNLKLAKSKKKKILKKKEKIELKLNSLGNFLEKDLNENKMLDFNFKPYYL